MNIYFCGIGGVGLGPLAEIALDAGNSVVGSDSSTGPMVEALEKRGVCISNDQSGRFLTTEHERRPIDWLVYTSAMAHDHAELQAARGLGIKVSKRDELLSEIIKQKNLKLIGIAGTHGKTTTTAMMAWAMKQLGIPISYSVGTTLTFGPSGRYEEDSEYFVYECDEFDKNFLHFNPHLALITSIDYDHPDTFPSPTDYMNAFQQFINQCEWAIMWQKDASLLDNTTNTWALVEKDVATVTLAGVHNRHNASLVIKACEKLGIQGNVIDALNTFPGSDRRFERIADNLYTDYGHHPIEIAATLQMARELNNDIVLVYQPHQNIRQLELRNLYTDCFLLARDIYWLPTYLTREKPELEVLTPEVLSAKVANHDAIHIAEMNDELWKHIEDARHRGALVICMGAGTIDAWIRSRIKD